MVISKPIMLTLINKKYCWFGFYFGSKIPDNVRVEVLKRTIRLELGKNTLGYLHISPRVSLHIHCSSPPLLSQTRVEMRGGRGSRVRFRYTIQYKDILPLTALEPRAKQGSFLITFLKYFLNNLVQILIIS